MRRARDTAPQAGEALMSVAAAVVAKGIVTQYILGWMSVGGGLLIALTGPDVGDRVRWFAALLWWPEIPGVLIALSGALVVFGLARRSARTSLTGYAACTIWYLLFAVGFVIQWAVFVQNPSGDPPFVYPVVMYLGFAALNAVYGEALIRERRAVRAAKRALGPDR